MVPDSYTRWNVCGIDTPQTDDDNGIDALYKVESLNRSMMKGCLYHPAFLRIASIPRFATPENDLSKKDGNEGEA
jgi:hypothetical protein